MRQNVLLIGNLTIDENASDAEKTFIGPGGSVFFLAKTFENLGISVTILSPYGGDFPQKYLPKTFFIPNKPLAGKTLLFKNIYKNNKRKQIVENYGEYLHFEWLEEVKTIRKDFDFVMIAPVINNFESKDLQKIKAIFTKSFLCLLPQGLYRQINKSGKIAQIDRDLAVETIRNFDFISFSEQDLANADEKASKWSNEGLIVAVTRDGKGASIYSDGERLDSPAFKVDKIVDPTGAGDIFAAGFVYSYFKKKQIKEALDFGQAAAALSLRWPSNRLQYSIKDIYERLNR